MKLAALTWGIPRMRVVAIVLAACNAMQAWGTLIILSGTEDPAYGCTFGVPRMFLATLAIVSLISLIAGAIALGFKRLTVARALLALDGTCVLAWVLSDGFGHAACVIGV